MADMLSTGVSGLLAFQRTLDTISHNIANANTDGYSRQQVLLTTRSADVYGNGWVGNGVDISSVRRVFDQALTDQLRSANSTLQQLDVFTTYAERIDNLLSDESTGLASSLQKFTDALESLSSSPSSATARQVMISQAQSLVSRLKSYDNTLSTMDGQINQQLSSEADVVSGLAKNIASLNEQIIRAQGQSQQPANDLLDQRDNLVSQLSQHLNVTTLVQDNGALNVYMGSGQALVTNTTAATLVAVASEFDPTRPTLVLAGQGTPVDVSAAISGGTLGGLQQFREELLDPTRNALGQIAVTLGTLTNQQQADGLDLNGNLGTSMFALGGVRASASSGNTSSATLTVTRTDLSALTASDYRISFDGTAWSAVRSDTGASVALAGVGTTASPLVVDGLSIVVNGTPQAGDAFLVQPTRTAIAGMSVLITNPDRIAVAAPLLTSANSSNSGTATISTGELLTPGSWVRDDYTLTFTSSSAWQITDSANNVVASGAYADGANIDFNGMRVVVSGTPAAGDSFSINDNAGGTADNRNTRSLIDLLNSSVLNGGTASISDAVGRLIGQIGVQTSQAATGRDAQSAIVDDAKASVQGVSGVNLDEEAANLVRYQQAYQAAAQVIAAANAMFDTLLEATHR
jgi:flagellar hook-associated protein 1 FlgK